MSSSALLRVETQDHVAARLPDSHAEALAPPAPPDRKLLRKLLGGTHRRWAKMAKLGYRSTTEPSIVLAIDAAVPWSRVVAAAEVLTDARIARVGFALQARQRLPMAASSKQRGRIKEAVKRGTEIALFRTLVSERCPAAAATASRATVGMDPKRFTVPLIIQLATEALGQCACRQDIASIKELLVAVQPNYQKVIVRRRLGGGGAKVRLPRARPWSEASSRVVALSGEIQLVAK
jgi:hypothetical protein